MHAGKGPGQERNGTTTRKNKTIDYYWTEKKRVYMCSCSQKHMHVDNQVRKDE